MNQNNIVNSNQDNVNNIEKLNSAFTINHHSFGFHSI